MNVKDKEMESKKRSVVGGEGMELNLD